MICFSYDPQTPKRGLQDIFSNIKPKSLLSCILKPPIGGLGVTDNKEFKKYINNNSLLHIILVDKKFLCYRGMF